MVLKAARDGRNFAIKAVINDRDEASENVMLRFRLEAEILRRLSHPRIPGFVEVFSSAEAHYLVQEYVEGWPLSHLLSTGRRFSEAEVKGIIRQLLEILNALHNPRRRQDAVVHRDLRLSNLMLSGDSLYLIDFGLARFIDGRQFPFCPDPPRREPGSPAYELMRREISPRSDLFGTGIVAVDLFTNWVEDEALFQESWDQVLPLSEPFKMFIKKLLDRDGFVTAAEALAYLN